MVSEKMVNAGALTSLHISSSVFSPLLRLSPPPSDHDYIYNLDETEGLCDLFDVPILNLWPNLPRNVLEAPAAVAEAEG